MILVDTSVWIDHLRAGDATLTALLETERVLPPPLSSVNSRSAACAIARPCWMRYAISPSPSRQPTMKFNA